MDYPISVALGKAFSSAKDLAYVHVPDGITKAEALAMVESANKATGFDPPYAFLVCEEPEDNGDDLRREVSPKEAIRYREDRHVAVVHGRKPDIPSFHNTFQEIVGQSFPDVTSGSLTLRRLSELVVDDVLHQFNLLDRDRRIAGILESCLTEVKDLYIEGHSDVSTWNSVWFRHCNVSIQNLQALLSEAQRDRSPLSPYEFFGQFAHASFGLPRPVRLWSERRSRIRDAKLLNDAQEEYWSQAESIENALRILSLNGREGHEGLLQIPWEEFEQSSLVSPNLWLSLAEFLGADLTRIKAFSVLPEKDFVNPGGQAESNVPLRLTSAQGTSLALQPEIDASPVLVPMTRDITLQDGYWSESVCLVVSLVRPADTLELDGSEVRISLSPVSQAEWSESELIWTESEIVVKGRIKWKSGTGKNASKFRQLNLTASFPSGTAAAPHLPLKAQTLSVLSFDAAGEFLALAPKKAKGAVGRPTVLGRWAGDADVVDLATDLKPTTQGFAALLWSANESSCYLDGKKIERHGLWSQLAFTHFVPTGMHEFSLGALSFRVSSMEVESGQQSAILAAALKQQVSPNRPSAPTVDSVRGQYEAFAAEALSSPDHQEQFMLALGHAAFPAEMQATMAGMLPQDGGAILMNGRARQALRDHDFIDFEFPEFILGPAAERFRNAAKQLGFDKRLFVEGGGDGVTFEWPSRISWRSLWQAAELTEYLESYVELLESAKSTENAALIFWATYPFSISIWDVDNGSGCSAVLLSPLHPIRLAWLAGVEDVLASATEPLAFLGSIEGWNFPISGPGSGTGHRLLAVPCDTGEGQLFTSWGMLVRASTSDPLPLVSPISIGSFDAPGTAVSGLNAQAVNAALRSFRKMHPHVTTLTVDLSAQKKQPRLSEIDSAVLKMAVNWKESQLDGLLGGIRVLDSVNRLGVPPRGELTKLVRDNPRLLFTWSRYNPRKVFDRACSIRFLQDSGSVLRVGNSRMSHGVVGLVPLRRFEANDGRLSGSHVNDSHPGIDPTCGWHPFTNALSAVENLPVVSSGISRGSLSDKSANWTVMGETYLSPSTISTLMGNVHGGEQMLWEWRPPVLDERVGRALLEKRPFVSVARVPRAFGNELDKLLRRASPEEETDRLRQSVMTTLGSRGVGLSSLLAMGGTHVAGAVGFYLALSLFDQTRSENTNRLIIPIDAADYFLRTLADGAAHGDFQHRADLLVMDLSDSGLTVTPVEIKAYGLQSQRQHNKLPEPDSLELAPALNQLKDSQELLSKIQGLSRSLRGADARLWWNSLTTLVEVAAKLSPQTLGDLNDFVRRMAALVNGQTDFSVGRPILMYFLHSAQFVDGKKFYAGPVGGHGSESLGLVCDMEKAFQAIRGIGVEPIVDAWQSLVRTALNDPIPETSVAVAFETPSTSGADHSPTEANIPAQLGYAEIDRRGGPDPADTDQESDASVAPLATVLDSGPELPRRRPLLPDNAHHSLSSQGPSSLVPEREGRGPIWGIRDEGVRINVGTVLDSVGNAPVDFWPSNTGLNQPNIGIVGDLGTGKTELIKALIAQIRDQARVVQPGLPTSMLIFDYKGDFQQEEFLERVGGVVLNPYRIPLNVFLPVTAEYSRKPFQQGAALVDTFKKIYSGIGPRQMSLLNQAVREAFQDRNDLPPTIADVRSRYEALVGDPDSVTSILDTFVFGEIFSADRDELLSFDELLEGRVVVVALNKLGQDSNTKNSLVALFLNLYHDYMLRAGLLPFEGKAPVLRYLRSFLLVDEAVNIMRYDFQVLEDIMLKGRGAGIGVMLASQYLSHFRAGKTDYGQPLRTWFIHKVPSVTAKELAALGITEVSEDVAQRIPALGNHQVLYKSFGWDRGHFVRVTPYYELYGE